MSSLRGARAATLMSKGGNEFVIRRKGTGTKVLRPATLATEDVRCMDSAAIEAEFLDIDVLTEEKLLVLSGAADLSSVTSLTFRVDATDQSLSRLGEMLPKLQSLRLDRSVIETFRDFGTSLMRLRELSLCGSQVLELDGVSALESLTVLNLDDNCVQSLSPLAMHENLVVLSLKNNQIASIAEVDQLGTCFGLRELCLAGNPIEHAQHYRALISHFLPQLDILDGTLLNESDRIRGRKMTCSDISRIGTNLAEWIDGQGEAKKKCGHESRVQVDCRTLGEEDDMVRARPSTPMHRLSDLRGDDLATRNHSSRKNDSIGSGKNLNEHDKPDSAKTGKNEDSGASNDKHSASSSLTHGADVVFAGNLAASMRRRSRVSRIESNETKLKLAAEKLSLDKRYTVVDPEDDLLGSGRISDEDTHMQRQLEDLLARSSGLERELHRLQSAQDPSSESPKNRLLRSKSCRKKGSTSPSSNASGEEPAGPNFDCQRGSRGRSTSSKSSKTMLGRRSSSALEATWKPAPPRDLPLKKKERTEHESKDADDLLSALAEFDQDLSDDCESFHEHEHSGRREQSEEKACC